jgi:hypothetical protein
VRVGHHAVRPDVLSRWRGVPERLGRHVWVCGRTDALRQDLLYGDVLVSRVGILLPERYNPVRPGVLPDRHRLHRCGQRSVRLSDGLRPVWLRWRRHLLPEWEPVRQPQVRALVHPQDDERGVHRSGDGFLP